LRIAAMPAACRVRLTVFASAKRDAGPPDSAGVKQDDRTVAEAWQRDLSLYLGEIN